MATPRPRLAVHPATPDRWPDLEALFGRNGACGGCWCQFWKQSNAEYRAGKGEANHAALRRSVKRGEVPGLLAYAGDEPVGWVAVEPRARYRRLAISRNLPIVDERPTWSVPCFFVARGWRGRGVAGRLLSAAVAHARRQGAPARRGLPGRLRPAAGRPLALPRGLLHLREGRLRRGGAPGPDPAGDEAGAAEEAGRQAPALSAVLTARAGTRPATAPRGRRPARPPPPCHAT